MSAAQPVSGLLNRPLSEVLGALASQHDLAGGGGPAAALVAAAAAALTAKVARGSRATWIEAGGAIAHAEALRMQAQALIERDAQAYHEASAALARDERSARQGVASPALAVPAPVGDRERLLVEALTHAADLASAMASARSAACVSASPSSRSRSPTEAGTASAGEATPWRAERSSWASADDAS